MFDHKFSLKPDGTVWAHTMFGATFFQRYLTVFKSIRVIARLRPVESEPAGAVRVDSAYVKFVAIPYYEGPGGYLRVRRLLAATIKAELRASRAVILRVHQALPSLAARMCRSRGIPYGVEVVGDPWDTFSPGAFGHPARALLRVIAALDLKVTCSNSAASSYVTQYALQRRYPPRKGTFTTYASSIELYNVTSEPRDEAHFRQLPTRLLFVGALNQLYKGQDILLRAFACVRQAGLDVKLVIVGDGSYRQYLENLCVRMQIEEHVDFKGALPAGAAVRGEMDKAHLFVLASRQEGLPRAAIEAMARGLPVLLTSVGGNGELVPTCELVPPNNVPALANSIEDKVSDLSVLSRESRRNLERSREYLHDRIQPRRLMFYKAVCAATCGLSA